MIATSVTTRAVPGGNGRLAYQPKIICTGPRATGVTHAAVLDVFEDKLPVTRCHTVHPGV